MSADPFNLDQTDFAKVIEQIRKTPTDQNAPDEPPHPLLDDPRVKELFLHMEEFDQELRRRRNPEGKVGGDAYFGLEDNRLRTEVIAKFVLDHCKAHPEILAD